MEASMRAKHIFVFKQQQDLGAKNVASKTN